MDLRRRRRGCEMLLFGRITATLMTFVNSIASFCALDCYFILVFFFVNNCCWPPRHIGCDVFFTSYHSHI